MHHPRIIPVGQEPPPLREPSPARPANGQAASKAKESARRAAGRFAVLNAFVDAGMAGLSRVELGVWLVLFRDARDGVACTSQAYIARRIGCSERGVVKAIQKLRKRGLLVRVQRGGINRGPSRYRVLPLPKLA